MNLTLRQVDRVPVEEFPNHDTCKVYVIRPASWGCHCLWDAKGLLPLSLSELTGISVIGAFHIILFLLSTNVVHHHYMQEEEDNIGPLQPHTWKASTVFLCVVNICGGCMCTRHRHSKYHWETKTGNWHNNLLWQFACKTLINVSSFTKKYHCYLIVF